ncbi:hypothetical protein J2853_002554 [Streptosporangium lutulentum]|uniref:Uncharacterized protein n=1 Tax=Streptosporangium lutulentum TaxID=1461250 RepID=A0ABT9Q9C8_9ACTN|nr:hypothetical protein [Streptosporangium lutulentum]
MHAPLYLTPPSTENIRGAIAPPAPLDAWDGGYDLASWLKVPQQRKPPTPAPDQQALF